MAYFVGFGGQVTIFNGGAVDVSVAFTDSADAAVTVYDDEARSSSVATLTVAAGGSTVFYFIDNVDVTVAVSHSGITFDTRVVSVANGNSYSYAARVGDESAHSLIVSSPDGTMWSIGVDDLGALVTTDVTPT